MLRRLDLKMNMLIRVDLVANISPRTSSGLKKAIFGFMIFVFAGIIFVLYITGILYVPGPKYHDPRSAFNRPDVEREMDEHAANIQKIEKEGHYSRLSEKLAEEGRYDEAIAAAEEALKYSLGKNAGAWMARRNLARIYERAGKYELALKELEWAESVQTRPDVLAELAQDRKRLEALIEGRSIT